MPDKPFRILMVAGEASGDLHGGGLAAALKSLHPRLEFEGVGGHHMARAGVTLRHDIEGLGGMGYLEVIHTLSRHARIFLDLRRRIARGEYRAAILINYPAFNLLLAGVCRRHGCPALFYISPQIWASRPGRIRRIRRNVTKMYVVLPFEERLYQEAGVPVAYLGHPFVDLAQPGRTPEEARRDFGLEPGVPTIGLFPGSRRLEVKFLLDDMLGAAERIQKALGRCRFLLPLAETIDPETVRARLAGSPVEVTLVPGCNYDVMQMSDFLILASGSATLEAALFECPMVIVYRVPALSYWVLRWFVHIRWFGLVNIVAQEGVVPELLNDTVTPERIAEEALRVLQDPAHRDAVRARLHRVRESLGAPGVLKRIAGDMARTLELPAGRPNETASC